MGDEAPRQGAKGTDETNRKERGPTRTRADPPLRQHLRARGARQHRLDYVRFEVRGLWVDMPASFNGGFLPNLSGDLPRIDTATGLTIRF